MSLPPQGGLVTYEGSVLKWIDASVEELDVDKRATVIYGHYDAPCSINVRSTLTKINFQEGSKLTKIQEYAFYKCIKLTGVDFTYCTELVSIGEYAFAECYSLKFVKFPSNLKIVDQFAFRDCSLGDVVVPACVETIQFGTFYNNKPMTSLFFEDNSKVNTLFKYLLLGSLVQSFRIPRNVKDIKSGTFENARSLTEITIEGGKSDFSIINNGLVKGDVFIAFPLGNNGSYRIPDGIKTIYVLAFYVCDLESIELPASLEVISGYSFAASKFLTSITIPEKVTFIGDNAFRDCVNLKNINFKGKCDRIYEYAFQNCNFTSINIPDGLTELGVRCFAGNRYLENVTLPSSLTSIGGGVFLGDNNLKRISCNKIMISNDFIMNSDGRSIIQCWNKDDEYDCVILNIIEVIKNSAFSAMKNIKSVSFQESSQVKTIEDSAFSYCSNLKTIVFPASLESIGKNAFAHCSSLVSVEISNVNEIEDSCFESCISIERVDLSKTKLVTIKERTFYMCASLSRINLPSTIQSFNGYCFYECCNLVELNIPENAKITKIGEASFMKTSIRSFELTSTSTVTEIERYAFYSCKIFSFNFTESIETIGSYAFASSSLAIIEFGSKVKLLKYRCFYNCRFLEYFGMPVSSQLEETGIEIEVFENCISLSTIVYHGANLVLYDSALASKDLSRIIIFPPASDTKHFHFPSSVKSVSSKTFLNCKKLQSVSFSQSKGPPKYTCRRYLPDCLYIICIYYM